MANRLSFINTVLYRLKRDFGIPVAYHKIDTMAQSTSTGAVTKTQTVTRIKRAAVLPTDAKQFYKYDRAYVAQDKPFTYGANYAISQREVIVDKKDLPEGFVAVVKDAFIIEHRRWEIKGLHEYGGGKAIVFLVEELKGAPVCEDWGILLKQSFILTQAVQ